MVHGDRFAVGVRLCASVRVATEVPCVAVMKDAFPFLKAVDPKADGVPDYFDIVKHPMDLGLVAVRLRVFSRPTTLPQAVVVLHCVVGHVVLSLLCCVVWCGVVSCCIMLLQHNTTQ